MDINAKWIQYEAELATVISTVGPLKKMKNKQKETNWYTKELRTLKRKMDVWHMRMKQENGKTTKENFTYHRNQYKRAVKKAKDDHWIERFNNATSSKQTWGLLNKVMQREQNHVGIKELICGNGQTTTDPKEKANIMNTFFANVGEETAKKIPQAEKEPVTYLDDEGINSER